MLTFNNITADSFAADTQQGAGRRRPRHREALSCSQCRDRKVRCDRKQPCKQCLNRGHPHNCSYGSTKDTAATYGNGANNLATNAAVNGSVNGSQTSSQNKGPQPQPPVRSQTEPSSPLSSTSAEFEMRRRLDRLELLIAAKAEPNGTTNTTTTANAQPIPYTNGREESKARQNSLVATGNSSLPARNALQCPQGPFLSVKTRFIGGTHWLAACNNMTVLKAMLNKTADFDNSHRSFEEIKAWTKSLNAVQIPYSMPFSDAASLSNLLPIRSTCEGWIRMYSQTYRHVYDIVDEFTLETAVEKVWNSPPGEDPTVICIVLLLVSIGMQIDEGERLNGRRLARFVEQYAFSSGLIQKPCIGSMKVLLLLTLSKVISCSDTETLDSLSGIMGMTTQVALAMGLHRNPTTFGSITNYHAEIRKRLWSVFFRLNMEHCMRIGIPLALQPEDTDVGYPANVNLDDLTSDTGLEVEGKELPYQTDATFSIIAARLAEIAAPYQRAICSAGSSVSPESIKQLRDAYDSLLAKAPLYMRPGAKTASAAEEIQQAFINIAMHSTSLTLALHFVINVPAESVQRDHLHTVWDYALAVMHSFQMFSQKPRHIQTLAYQLLWSDACRAAFSAGMALNRLRVIETRSILATRLHHTLIPFRDTLVKYLTYMSRFWLQSAHLGPAASKNCLLLAMVLAVTSRLFSEENDVSERELIEIGAQSAEHTVDMMRTAMKRRHSFPISPEPSVSSASQSSRLIGEAGRSVSSPDMVSHWPTASGMMAHSNQPHATVMDPFPSSVGSVFGHPFVTPDPSSVGWTPQDMQWSMDGFEYNGNSASMSPISHVPTRQTTTSTYVDGLISPPGVDWAETSQWVDNVGMNTNYG